jgi:hypothetical protein
VLAADATSRARDDRDLPVEVRHAAPLRHRLRCRFQDTRAAPTACLSEMTGRHV